MQLKNINIILAFTTLALRVLSSPINNDESSVSVENKILGNISFSSEASLPKRRLIKRKNEETEEEEVEDVVSSDDETIEVVLSDSEEKDINNNPEDSEFDEEITDVETEYVTEYITDAATHDENTEFEGENYIARWDYTPEEILKLVEDIKNEETKIIKQIEQVPDDECSFETVIYPIGRKIENIMEAYRGNLNILEKVATDKNVRDTAYDAQVQLDTFEMENISGNKIIQQKILKVAENIANGKFKAPTHPEDIKFYESMTEKTNGNDVEKQAEIFKLEMRANQLAQDIMNCIDEDETTVVIKKSDLDGVPERYFDMLEPTTEDGEDAFIIDMYNGYTIVKNYAKKDSARKAAVKALGQRCKPNVARLTEYVQIKQKVAHMNGYKAHSDYILKSKMAMNTTNVFNFLDSLKEKLQPIARAEMDKLLKYKKIEKEELNEEYDGILHLYDTDYYKRILTAEEYAVDGNAIKEYFPVKETIREMLNIYEIIFSLKFKEVENPNTWHPDVILYEAYDKKTEKFIGSFYLDLYKRAGKISYTASPYVAYGYEKEDGTRYPGSACLITNFNKPAENEPSLLSHSEVTAIFHELGHVFHEINSETRYIRYNGYNVEQDFLEAPSQMLEYWCYEPEIIERLSHHYKDTSKRMPKDLIDKIIKSKNISSGSYSTRLLFQSYVDMTLYSMEEEDPNLDVVEIWNKLRKEITMQESIEDTWPIATFDHIVDGYDAGYYGYLWSQVYSADMYAQFKKYGILNSEIGEKYRNTVLKAGSSKSGMEILTEFLGREPNDEAFIKTLGQ